MDNKYIRISVKHGPKVSHSIDKNPSADDFKLHVHDCYEILCVVSGNVGYLVEGREYDLYSGCIILTRPAETHKLTVRGKGVYERYVLSFHSEDIRSMGLSENMLMAFNSRELGEKNQYFSAEFNDIEPESFFKRMCEQSKEMDSRTVILSNLAALLCSVNSVFIKKKTSEEVSAQNDVGRKMLDYVNKHLTEEISLESVSEYVHMSPSQVNRIFRKMTGTSVYNYILSKRLVMVQELISSGVGAVAASQRCGFGDYSSFYRFYKKRTGKAPGNLKKK